MKTLLNLLPEEKKADIRRKLHFRFFLWQLFLAFALEIFYMSMLIGIYFILNFQLQSLQTIEQQYDTAYAQQKQLDTYQQQFRDTNAAVDEIGRIERNHFSFTQIFRLLDTTLPAGIAIERLSTKDYTVTLFGQAATRDDLLAFDGYLKEAACVKTVNVPLSNLFSQDNVEFQIDFEIQQECLKKNDL
ncbi:MAG: hypothetical protein A3E38_02660 [Candidatus Moranbacteria bacterium RIFCSPHIGHO2_12_FULL_54_9]|nr:MAG: hypothetical protein A2878_01845 [Candidatus Moranbacteria bacterium RIFCSPHIGHO2_01_FULL_54_31]OGI25353.1 MAG: hypothetical protein A3E38_02660 [Candidatus Moranbacteria bacterium RIFCSPHIGHO2_12_FULL_54_9]